MGYKFEKYSIGGGGASEEEVVQIVKTNFEGGVGYETTETGTIIPEQTLTLEEGAYSWEGLVALIEGMEYTVSFNGVTSVKTAVKADVGGLECIYIGNGSLFGLEATDDLFLLYSVPSMGVTQLVAYNHETVPTPVFSLLGTTTVVTKIDNKFVNILGTPGISVGAEVFNTMPAENASGDFSHAEGWSTVASGYSSHSEGSSTKASNNNSHAEGSFTTASGNCSHGEGYETTASGDFSHTEGYTTGAKAYASHAEGFYTVASSVYQHVQGRSNIEDAENKYAHIVGNGSNDNDRSNAHTLDWDGNAWFAGKVKVGGTGYNDPNAVELGAGGSGGGLSIKSITFTDRPTAWEWLVGNYQKVIKAFLSVSLIPMPLVYSVVTATYDTSTNEVEEVHFTTVYPNYISENQVKYNNIYLKITSTETEAITGENYMTASNTPSIVFGGSTPTTLPDGYWSTLSGSLTVYYIG